MGNKRDKAKPESKKANVRRRRFGKHKGAEGGRSATAMYPRHGDKTDQMYRVLHNTIVRTPAKKWGCDAAGKEVALAD
jgi:hypothetical protein